MSTIRTSYTAHQVTILQLSTATSSSPAADREYSQVSVGGIILIILVLLFIGALPRWRHSANWGYYPSGGIGILLLILLILVLTGHL